MKKGIPYSKRSFNVLAFDQPYDCQWDLLVDLHYILMLGKKRITYWVEETDQLMNAFEEDPSFWGAQQYFLNRMQLSSEVKSTIPIFHLKDAFHLSTPMTVCIAVGLLGIVDPAFSRCSIGQVLYWLGLLVVDKGQGNTTANEYSLSPYLFLLLEVNAEEKSSYQQLVQLKETVVDYLLQNQQMENAPSQEGYRLGGQQTVLCQMEAIQQQGEKALVWLVGEEGSGKKYLINQMVESSKKQVCWVELSEDLGKEAVFGRKVAEEICSGILHNQTIAIAGFNYLIEEEKSKERRMLLAILERARELLKDSVWITSSKWCKSKEIQTVLPWTQLKIPDITVSERVFCLKQGLSNLGLTVAADYETLATNFPFNIGKIQKVLNRMASERKLGILPPVTGAALMQCFYEEVQSDLERFTYRVPVLYSFADIVLPEEQLDLLYQGCMQIKYRHIVYGDWGFDKKVAYGKGMVMLFAGTSGTGKTMGAQVMAKELEMELYKVKLSQVISKYVGETEKNLEKIFTEASKANCLLFFDETDALFGKRSEVKDAQDRHANIEVAYLLQQLESYEGNVIMATNLLQNMDEAFLRRMQFIVHFPFPDAANRKILWEKNLSNTSIFSKNIDLDFLSKQFRLSGGNIKNIVVTGAFLAAARQERIGMEHLLKGLIQEQRKYNILVTREDLQEYADLIY